MIKLSYQGIAFAAIAILAVSIIFLVKENIFYQQEVQPENCDIECFLTGSSANCPGNMAHCNCLIFSASSYCSEKLTIDNFRMNPEDALLIEKISLFAQSHVVPTSEGKKVSELFIQFQTAYQSGDAEEFESAQKDLAHALQNTSSSNREALNSFTKEKSGKTLF